MKASRKGWQIEGTPEEILSVINGTPSEEIEENKEELEVVDEEQVTHPSSKRQGIFTREEDLIIKEGYKGTDESVKLVAEKLNRTQASIYARAVQRLNLGGYSAWGDRRDEKTGDVSKGTKKGPKRYTKNEDQILKDEYDGTDESVEMISKKLNRTRGSVYNRAVQRLELGTYTQWRTGQPGNRKHRKKRKVRPNTKHKSKTWSVRFKWINQQAKEIQARTGCNRSVAFTKACKKYNDTFKTDGSRK